MRVSAAGVVRTGRAVDLRDLPVAARALVRSVRGDDAPPVVHCPPPGPVHEHVGHVHEGMGLSVRAALASVARAGGRSAPQDDELARLRGELAAIDPPPVDLASERQRLADHDGTEVDRLREAVAAHRGALRARDELDADGTPAREALADAVGRLSDRETAHHAARQALARGREAARAARDRRERRLRLEDRIGNRERDARAHLAETLLEAFAAAVDAVPGAGRVPETGGFEGPVTTAALAVARLAPLRAPVVVEGEHFRTAPAAARVLDAPVVLV